MEDDDEFGDLYTDVLKPFTASFSPQSPSSTQSMATPPLENRAIEPKRRDGKRSPDGAPDSDLEPRLDSKSRVLDGIGGTKSWETAFGEPNVLDESGIDALVEVRDDRDGVLVKTIEDAVHTSENVEKSLGESENFGREEIDIGIGDMGLETTIPGLLKTGGSIAENEKVVDGNEKAEKMKEQTMDFEKLVSTFPGRLDGRDKDYSDSDSEDDLQIVLNDDDNNDDDDEDEDGRPLVIVADDDDVSNKRLMDEQEWGGEADGERKELDDGAKASAGAAVAPKIAYSSHVYHPYHSQFKVSDVVHLGSCALVS